MGNPNLQQQPTKNVKNLSIKEFFTNRLMRTRSFEGGPHSPKDETSNWFDEFKARMTKKSQSNANKQPRNEDNNDETSSEYGEPSTKGKPSNQYNDSVPSVVKETCDNPYSKSTKVEEDLSDASIDDEHCQQPVKNNSELKLGNKKSRARKGILRDVSSPDRYPDFDTASIRTIFDRRDSRYLVNSPSHRGFFCWLTNFFRSIISLLFPFNYNLSWKLISITNFSFMVIVIGLANKTNPNIMNLGFLNGFICGILIAAVCFIILMLSFLVTILPRSRNTKLSPDKTNTTNENLVPEKLKHNVNLIDNNNTQQQLNDTTIDSQNENFTFFEELENECYYAGNEASLKDNLLDDDDYKGWMIEFIGDYELRNKSDIKLKLIYVKVENRVLQLCKPKNNHDPESTTFPTFIEKRTYDLNNVKRYSATLLLPKNVRNRQKWVWSKKYPIRLEFQEDSAIEQSSKQASESAKTIQLTLFAKSCREKEEWFRRFKRIVEDNKLASGGPEINLTKRASLQSQFSIDDESINLDLNRSSRCVSPNLSSIPSRKDLVQTSHSSNILNDLKRQQDSDGGEEYKSTSSPASLSRTKSCEALNQDNDPTSSPISDDTEKSNDCPDSKSYTEDHIADGSTLTQATAELFSRTIEYSNFLESRPNLIYKDYIERVIEAGLDAGPTSNWFNALIGRICFDVFSHNYWSLWFKKKIQRKLYRIRLPYFMETLTLTKIDLGKNAPQFLNVVSHSFDSFGLSIDFDMAYSGGLTMTFETKLNLLKIKADNSSSTLSATASSNSSACANTNTAPINTTNLSSSTLSATNNQSFQTGQQQTYQDLPQKENNPPSESSTENVINESHKSSLSSSASTKTSGESSQSDDSESDSSSDSSVDEADVDEISDWEDYGAEKTKQSILRFVDKIASSRYFQHATENRYIKKKLQDISNCPLVLIVQIQSLSGVLTLNVPPPQTDRIWYGFKPNPELTLKALPKMGDREVNLSHVTDWIERKLAEEFRKILVIPNMEDVVLPVLKSDHMIYVTTTK